MKTFLPMTGKRRRGGFQPLKLFSKWLGYFLRPSHFALLLAGGLLLATTASAQKKDAGRTFDEYEVKAVFLLNFSNYSEWPAEAFASADAPFTFGVLGDCPFGTKLEAALKGEKVKGREIKIRRARKVEELKDCQVVFVGRSEKARVEAVIAALRGKPVLTVSDLEDFCRACGIACFTTEDNRVRFQINAAAARAGGLKISSQLLALAKLVECDALKEAP